MRMYRAKGWVCVDYDELMDESGCVCIGEERLVCAGDVLLLLLLFVDNAVDVMHVSSSLSRDAFGAVKTTEKHRADEQHAAQRDERNHIRARHIAKPSGERRTDDTSERAEAIDECEARGR